jgi:hypothetical protein
MPGTAVAVYDRGMDARRRFGGLALFPFAFAGIFAAIALVAGQPGAQTVLLVETEAGRVAALAGGVLAGLTFHRGDYPRRAWLLGASCFALLLVTDLGNIPAVAAIVGSQTDLVRGLVSLVANVAWIAQMAMLARAWSLAGLAEEGSVTRRGLWLAGAGLAALALEGGPLVHDVRSLLAGDVGATIAIAAELGAGIGLALLTSVMRTALTLSGGLLRWPWGLLTASGVAWAALDGVTALGESSHIEALWFWVVYEACRALACGLYCAAGLAQRRVIHAA